MQKFIARQPILDVRSQIFGYELLFRSGLESYCSCDDGDRASSNVVADSLLLFGMQTLTKGRKAFINFTQDLLLRQFATLLPKNEIIVEVLENVKPNAEVVAACKALKEQGYVIALDDFVFSEEVGPLLDLAEIVKVDFLSTSPVERQSLARFAASRRIRLLAEKVETHGQHQEAVSLGYTYFQGFFFSKPEILRSHDVPAYKLNYLLLMQAISRGEPDFAEIEDIIKREPSISYKLLRYLNSAAFAFTSEIQSIQRALAMVGTEGLRRLFSVIALAGMGKDKPAVLVISALVRAKMCEAIAPLGGLTGKTHDLFFIGLLSMIDTILQRPMAEILQQLSISSDVRSALLDGKTPLSEVLDLVLAVEKGDWPGISVLSESLGISEGTVADAYVRSVQSANEVFQINEA